jgi:membrane-associated phospholipid phosphatase
MRASRAPARSGAVPWRAATFVAVLVAYVALTLGIMHQSPLLTVDRDLLHLQLRRNAPSWFPYLRTYVLLGQRGPSTLVALPWLAWRAWKTRSARPLLMLLTALIVLNLSVGVVKLATVRLGPMSTSRVHAVFVGGNIYPSGHTSNAVVLYGVIAMLAVGYRRTTIALAVFISLTVGLSTVYLDTHWLSDVVGGWMAGALVLLVLPNVMPYAERLAAAFGRRLRQLWRSVRRRRARAAAPARSPVLVDRSADIDAVRVIRAGRTAPPAPAVATASPVPPVRSAGSRSKV